MADTAAAANPRNDSTLSQRRRIGSLDIFVLVAALVFFYFAPEIFTALREATIQLIRDVFG